ncbi:MAG TPA: FAD-dependent oxidoreductase [Nocardioides sp.]|nr:FAD-dependent oxidoreductase [Nocardioides sp.]
MCAQARRRGCRRDARRPQRLPPVPAPALPGGDVAAARGGHRPPAPDDLPGLPLGGGGHRPRRGGVAGRPHAAARGRSDPDRVPRGDGGRNRPNFFGVPGADEHAFPLYSVADAERLRLHLQEQVRAASSGSLAGDGTLDVVVVGGGPTGVETTGALVELMNAWAKTGRTPYRGQVTLVDRGDTLLGAFAEKAHHYSLEKLTKAGAGIKLHAGVAAVHADRVEFDDGTTIPTRTVVWGGGEAASAIAENAGPPTGRGGRIDVEPDLTVTGFPGVYAVGDVANIPSTEGTALPQLGSVAQQSGVWAAQNILRERGGMSTKPFHYKDKGIMAMIGRNAAVAEVGKHRHQVDGPIAFAAWLGVHASLLSGAHSRTDAFLTWAWDYFDRDHAATVEATAAPKRIAWGDRETDVPHISLEAPPSTADQQHARGGTTT